MIDNIVITKDLSNTQLLKIIFDLKNELSSYKKETDKKINELLATIDDYKNELNKKDIKINLLNDTIETMKKEHTDTINIMKNEINSLKKENRNLKKIIKQKDKEIKKLNKENNNLEKNNTKLENQKAKNSSNSSKPPSTNGFHKIVHSLKEKSDKNVGGQKGHKGSTLAKDNINKIINSSNGNVIIDKKTLFVSNKNLDGKTKFQIDTQLSVIVTEYNLVYDKNAPKLPKELKNTVTYGKNLKSLVSLLNVEHAVPVLRTVDIIRELTNGLIQFSTGTISNIIYELKSKIKPALLSIKNFLLRSEVNHKDETMLYCNGDPRWLHVLSNKLATIYYYHKKRGNEADIEKGILRIFTGILVHDYMKGLYRFQCDDAECNAHILRYLQFTVECYNRQWAKDLKSLLLDIKDKIKEEMIVGYNCLKTEDILKYENKYSDIIRQGKEEFINDKNPHKDYNGDDMKLLRRLGDYQDNHLAFMYDFRIPFDNNLAERDLRMIKAKKKISGCFRSDKGGEAYTDVKSYLSTMKKQSKNLYESIRLAFEGKPVLI